MDTYIHDMVGRMNNRLFNNCLNDASSMSTFSVPATIVFNRFPMHPKNAGRALIRKILAATSYS